MTSASQRRLPSKALNPSEAHLDTLKSALPLLASLFDKLEHGGGPNFLDIMLAIDEVVAFYTNPDQNSGDRGIRISQMSHNKCLFCS